MILFSNSVAPLSDFPTFIQPLAQINPLFLVIHILLVLELNELEDFDATLNSTEKNYCAAYDEWSILQAAEQRINEITAGMDCTETINALTFWTTTSTAVPTIDPDQDIFCQAMIEKTMLFNTFDIESDLFYQWIIQLAVVSLTIRVMAVGFLYLINRDLFSWCRARLCSFCMCNQSKCMRCNNSSKAKVDDSIPYGIEIQEIRFRRSTI